MSACSRAHQRKSLEAAFEALPKADALKIRRLALILRLAVLLHRTRTPGWLAAHPLTAADLAQERKYLARTDLEILNRS